MHLSRRLAVLFVALMVTFIANRAVHAKEEFPGTIAQHLALPYHPPCRVCHIQGTTGAGSIQTPFGVALLARGLTAGHGTLVPALDALATDKTDSDGDGVGDIDELKANTDPNSAAPVPLEPGGPTYGCAVAPTSGAGGRSSLPPLLLLLFLLAAFAGWRRRRTWRTVKVTRESR